MFVAILTSATMFSSCVDYVDNPVTPVPEPVETEKQAQFWSKFDKWQTDSCTVGDDFYMAVAECHHDGTGHGSMGACHRSWL